MTKRRRTPEDIKRDRDEKNRLQLERWKQQEQRKREKQAQDAEKRKEAAHRAWLKAERSKPREPISAQYGEEIHVHKRVYEAFMKQVGKKIEIESMKAVGGAGGVLVVGYKSRNGSHGTLELKDLGQMPK